MAANKCGQQPAGKSSDNTPLVNLELPGCRGYCPAYKLEFRNNGSVLYEGFRNMTKLGKDSIKLTASELQQVKTTLKTVNLWQYPEVIKSMVADAPMGTLTVFEGEKSHSVSGSIDRPKPILELEELLKTVVEAHGLKVKKGVDPYAVPPNQQELLVKFKPEVNPGNFLMQFEEIKLRIVRRVSAENQWIIGYNPDQISEKQIIEMFTGMDGVLEAKPNTAGKKN